MFLRTYSVMATGPTIAEAWEDLCHLERAAEARVKALSTGRPPRPDAPDVARRVAAQMREGDRESARLHLESVKRTLMRHDPAFAT